MKKEKIKAKIGDPAENGVNMCGEKELINYYTLIAVDPRKRGNDRIREAITVRCWMGRSRAASTVYASIWVRKRDGGWTSGHGKAGGHGYDKISASIDGAIRSAGIALSRSISGVGDSAVREALGAIADAVGYQRCSRLVI